MAAADAIDRLKSQLLVSSLQQSNPALFQVINQLIGILRDTTKEVEDIIGGGGGGGSISTNQSIATVNPEQATLPNSRQLMPGTGINFHNDGQRLLISGSPIPGGMGEQGEEGLMGVPGIQGPIGPTGPTGPAGVSGGGMPFGIDHPEEAYEYPALVTLLNGNSIPETAIQDGILLARVADNETISGRWTITNTRWTHSASGPRIDHINTGAAVDEKVYSWFQSGSDFILRTGDDTLAAFTTFLALRRTLTAPTSFEVASALVLSAAQTPTLSADQTAWNPTGLGSSFYFSLNVTAPWIIRGIVAQRTGTVIVLFNNSAATFSITGEDGAAAAADRMTLPGAVTINVTSAGSVTLYYDGVRWRLIGRTI